MVRKQIAIYGKGGIGKSTTSSNIAAAMAKLGKRVMLVGCDPKEDSTLSLCGGQQLPSVLETMYKKGEANLRLEDVCFKGPYGMLLVESGGPDPGVGCAGRGVITALQTLERLDVFKRFEIDVVIYDVLGDVVCGGFAMPLRTGFAKECYLVTSGELMALYAANNICKAIKRFYSSENKIGLAGLILNCRNIPYEDELVTTLASRIGAPIAARIPRDHVVQSCEARKETVVIGEPNSAMAQQYMNLAKNILSNDATVVPDSITRDQLTDLVSSFGGDEGLIKPASRVRDIKERSGGMVMPIVHEENVDPSSPVRRGQA